ncbi:MAG: DUF6127 family protein [Gammaproteobacteria bacterium]|nr:DUF6127 family protein [Gammaproteobacteria bacterium]
MSELTPSEIEQIIERAAERGAIKALHSVGLQDNDAAHDVAELRSLLLAWRTVRMSMIKTAANMFTAFLLGALALGAGLKFWKGEGP